nr:unnamed protein product [Callosobruchus chinensis]
MPRNELSAFDRTRIIALWQEGLSRHQIANRLNVVISTINRTIRRYEETGKVNSRPRTGRPTISTRREDRYVAQLARRERSVTVPVLRSQFQRTCNRVISTATIRRKVLATRLRCRRLLRVPLLTARYHTARLQWARAHQDWLLPQWGNVLFSDEFRFGLVSDDYRERVWRERGGQNRLATAIGVAPYRDGTQMFWGGIRFNGITQLISYSGSNDRCITCKASLLLSFDHYVMKSETSSSLWTIMPDHIAPKSFNKPWKTKYCKIGMAGNIP